MPRLLLLFLLVFVLPATAGVFDSKPVAGLTAATAGGRFLPVSQVFRPLLVGRELQKLRIHFENAEGYYLYRARLKVESDPAGLTGVPQLPDGQRKHDESFGEVEVYYGDLEFDLPLNRPAAETFTLVLTWQGCADAGLCYPPETTRLTVEPLPGQVIASATPASEATASPARSSPPRAASGWTFSELALFFLAGLGLTFTPCVLPMLPILSGVVLRGQAGGLRGLLLASSYALAMAASFAVLGALMGVFGSSLNLQARLQSAWVLVPFALFFAGFSLAMFGVYELRLPQFLHERLDRLAGHARGGSLLGAALLGVLSSLLVSPCVSAPLAGALLYISSSGDAFGGGLKLFALGCGMGTPLVLFAAGGGALLPRAGVWMVSVRNAFGVLLLGVAIWLLDRVLPSAITLLLWGLLAGGTALWLGALEFVPKTARQRLAQLLGLLLLAYALAAWFGALRGNSNPLQPLASSSMATGAPTAALAQWQTITSASELAQVMAEAKAAGQPLLLDWYADWCISCKVIEREVFAAAEVQPLLSGLRLLRFDITANTPEQRGLLDRYQLFGPPAVLFFGKDGQERSELRLIGEITAAQFTGQLGQLTGSR